MACPCVAYAWRFKICMPTESLTTIQFLGDDEHRKEKRRSNRFSEPFSIRPGKLHYLNVR